MSSFAKFYAIWLNDVKTMFGVRGWRKSLSWRFIGFWLAKT